MQEHVNIKRDWVRTALALVYYLVSFLVFRIGEAIAPSDMCNPGLGMIYMILVFPVLTAVLCVRSIIIDLRSQPRRISIATCIHLLAIGSILVALFVLG